MILTPSLQVSSGLPSPPSSPPLAALTSANELALISKNPKKRDDGKRSRKEGAAYTIREECERLFCETLTTVFGDEKRSFKGSYVMGANAHSPPDESVGAYNNSYFANGKGGQAIDAWIEVWDYSSGCSFRAFVGGDGENKSLFAFFDSAVVGSDLKQG